MTKLWRACVCWSLLFCCVAASVRADDVAAPARPPRTPRQGPTNALIDKADQLAWDKNWAEARTAYDAARDAEPSWSTPVAEVAVTEAIACSLQLQLWDDAMERAQQYIDKTKGSLREGIGERLMAALYVRVPHYGTKRGGVFLRGQYSQGGYVYSSGADRKQAIAHYERARQVLLNWSQALTDRRRDPGDAKRAEAERIGIDFDLAAILQQRPRYNYWGWFGWWWGGGGEAEDDSSAVEDADYEEPRGWYSNDAESSTPPEGLPLAPDGTPRFMTVPADYAPELPDGLKIRFLLAEIERLDSSETKDKAALARLRWAGIARSLYGPEATAWWRNRMARTDAQGNPLPARAGDIPLKKVWELGDDEALTVAGGMMRLVRLSPEESPDAITHSVAVRYPGSSLLARAQYERAAYFQSRQQFPRAMDEYRILIAAYPTTNWAKVAQAQIDRIELPQVALTGGATFLTGNNPRIRFGYRNAETIEFVATRFDLLQCARDELEKPDAQNNWEYSSITSNIFYKERWKKYLGTQAATWKQQVERVPDNRDGSGAAMVPLTEPGAYIVEANVQGGKQASHVLVLITDMAIVQKSLPGKGLIWLSDARSGLPLAGKAVRIYEHWNDYKDNRNEPKYLSTVLTTNDDGVIEYTRQHQGAQVEAIASGEERRVAFSFFMGWNDSPVSGWNGYNYAYYSYMMTDRPVYRPGATVQFHAWLRRKEGGDYQVLPQGTPVTLTVTDTKRTTIKTVETITDAYGGASGTVELSAEAPLGVYRVTAQVSPNLSMESSPGYFRVEEYKKPEFEVTVTPAKSTARLGETVRATIAARYYFGAPVANGRVTYKIFREGYHQVYEGEGAYDWLYGRGYGRYIYAYPWLPWWGLWGGYVWWGPWQPQEYTFGNFDWAANRKREESDRRKALRELVAQGSAPLGADGTYSVSIDSSKAPPDGDSRYTVEADVSDASRRTISGEGSVVASRRQFSAFVETDGGWYRSNSDAQVKVRVLTPDDVPVAVKGTVRLAQIKYRNDGSGSVEEEVAHWDAETDADGRLAFKYAIPGPGQYRISFITHDAWNEEVQGNAVFWVNGVGFEGREYRFNDLEVIADKRTYNVGDTAHLLINTAKNDARVLFSDDCFNGVLNTYRFIDIPGRSTVIDVPVGSKQVPNFFVEAALVRDGALHDEVRELFVPPVRGLLNVRVSSDKATYKPGETGHLHVTATDSDGHPARGQVALTAYDRAVTYIQDEFGPNPRLFFYGQTRSHNAASTNSLQLQFYDDGSLDGGEWVADLDYWPANRTQWMDRGGGGMSGITEGMYDSIDSIDDLTDSAGAALSSISLMGQLFGANGPASYSGGITQIGQGLLYSNDLEAVTGRQAATERAIQSVGPQIEPEIRSNFADTALWLPDLTLNEKGEADATITFPQSLTDWKLHAYAISGESQVGDATGTAHTSKKLMVRLEAPRFFVERDEVTISAIAHNYLGSAKQVHAELLLPGNLFDAAGNAKQIFDERYVGPANGMVDQIATRDADGMVHLLASANVPANGEHRFDWTVRVSKAGLAQITVKATTDEESDGMRLAFPVLVHGVDKTVAQSGSFRVAQEGARTLELKLPEEIDGEQTHLQVKLSPSLAGVMIDALPYLLGYPYGCVEQTMDRFYPAVLVRDSLAKLGTDLETIGRQRKQMDTGDLANRFGRYNSPVYDSAQLDRMVTAGLLRIYTLQHRDGGWGWWADDDSNEFQSAYVLQGLHAARLAGIKVDGGVYEQGLGYLRDSIEKDLTKTKDGNLGGLENQAYLAYVLSLDAPDWSTERGSPSNRQLTVRDKNKWLDDLYARRGELTNYGRSLLALAMHQLGRNDEASMLLRNILQFAERDDTNETAWVRTPEQGWWFWWNNDIETNAWVLRAMSAIDPGNDLAPRMVKWLVNNRRNGYYWNDTRDTSVVIAALTDYMTASHESTPDYTVTVDIDGKLLKSVKIDKSNFFSFDNSIDLYGLQLPPGPHHVTVSKAGAGALYYSAYLSYFTKEEDVKGAGNEILVDRQYFKLVSRPESVIVANGGVAANPPAAQGTDPNAGGRTELRDTYLHVPLKTGDTVASGDLIEVVLTLTAKNTYDYLAFEDMKPAGCEPVELQSGGRYAGGLCANMELRDTKTVFFIGLLEQGQHILRYKLRAETPGKFHALPAKGYAMYAPEVKAISDEMRINVSPES